VIDLDPTDRITVAGLPGTGKTTLTRYLADMFSSMEGTSLLIYDPLSQYVGFTPEEIYLPKSDSLAEFEGVCRRLCSVSNTMFVVEEAERYLGQDKRMGPYTFDFINRSRNWGCGIMAVTRRIQRLSKDFFDLCQHAFFFRCGLRSKDYIWDMIGREAALKVFSLPQYHFLYYSVETERYEVGTLVLSTRPHIDKEQEKVVVEERAVGKLKTEVGEERDAQEKPGGRIQTQKLAGTMFSKKEMK